MHNTCYFEANQEITVNFKPCTLKLPVFKLFMRFEAVVTQFEIKQIYNTLDIYYYDDSVISNYK